MATAPAAALGIICGTHSGDIAPGPRSSITECWVSIVAIPPIPVPITQPTSVPS